mgnify:FL=1
MDPYTNDDSASNQSDSSSSSTNIPSRKQQLLNSYLSASVRPQMETEQTAVPLKRSLITKNTGHGEKRKRNISSSGVPSVKKEPNVELNDEVCFALIVE